MRVPWPVLIVALVLPTAGTLIYFVAANPDDPLFRLAYSSTKLVQFTLPVVALLAFESRRLRAIRWSLEGIAIGAVLGVLTISAIISVYFLVFRDSSILEGLALRSKRGGRLRPRFSASFIALAVFLSIVHSFLEEYYWQLVRFRGPTCSLVATSRDSDFLACLRGITLSCCTSTSRIAFWTATLPFSLAVAVGGCWGLAV